MNIDIVVASGNTVFKLSACKQILLCDGIFAFVRIPLFVISRNRHPGSDGKTASIDFNTDGLRSKDNIQTLSTTLRKAAGTMLHIKAPS